MRRQFLAAPSPSSPPSRRRCLRPQSHLLSAPKPRKILPPPAVSPLPRPPTPCLLRRAGEEEERRLRREARGHPRRRRQGQEADRLLRRRPAGVAVAAERRRGGEGEDEGQHGVGVAEEGDQEDVGTAVQPPARHHRDVRHCRAHGLRHGD